MKKFDELSNPDLFYENRRTTVAALLKRLREEQGLKQADIARHTGFSQPEVSRLETGERTLKFVEIDFYARALGLDVGSFTKDLFETMWEADNPRVFPRRHPC